MNKTVYLIENESLKLKIYDILKEIIINNKFEASSHLVINKLCGTFGVSSTPIRDTLPLLKTDGLVEDKKTATTLSIFQKKM